MAIVQDGGILLEETQQEFDVFFTQTEIINYVVLAKRPGAADCLQTLEHTHYTPGTKRNELFVLRFIEWEGLPWFIVSIPITEKIHMERSASASGLRVADGVPTMIGADRVVSFPVNNRQTFTLENVPGHPVYKEKRT